MSGCESIQVAMTIKRGVYGSYDVHVSRVSSGKGVAPNTARSLNGTFSNDAA